MKTSVAIIRGLAIPAIAITIAHLSSCAPKAIPVPPLVKQNAAPSKPSASPVIEDARRITGQADQQGAVSASQLAKAQETATTAQRKAREALAEADRLAKQKSATEVELTRQKSLVEALCNSMDVMEVDLAETAKSLGREKELRIEASAMLVHAQELVRGKDAEADSLRMQLNHAADQVAAYYQAADQNAKAAMTAQGKVAASEASTRTWRGIAIWCGVAAALLLLIFVVVPIIRKTSIGL